MRYVYPLNQKLRTLDMVERLQEVYKSNAFFNADVADLFTITLMDACVRTQRLRQWGLVRYADRIKAVKGGYALSDYGLSFKLNKKVKE